MRKVKRIFHFYKFYSTHPKNTSFLHDDIGVLVHSKKFQVSKENGSLQIGARGVDVEIIGTNDPLLQEEINFQAFAFHCNENQIENHPKLFWNEFKFENFYRPLTNQFRFFLHQTPIPSVITRILDKFGRDESLYFLDQIYKPKFILLRFTVPSNFSIDVETDLSDVGVNKINGNISVTTQNGYIAIGETNSQNLNLKSEKGNMFLDDLHSKDINIESLDGDIYINKIYPETVKIQTKGDVVVEHAFKGKYSIFLDSDFKFYMMENGVHLDLVSRQRFEQTETTANLMINANVNTRLFVKSERTINLESVVYRGLKRDFQLNGVVGASDDSPKSHVNLNCGKTNVDIDTFQAIGEEVNETITINPRERELIQKRNLIGIVLLIFNLIYFAWSVDKMAFRIEDIDDPSIEEFIKLKQKK
jgi:hypothetical protein